MSADELNNGGPLATAAIPNPIEFLLNAEVELEGRMPWSSNATFLVTMHGEDGATSKAIYKPIKGERPLWDFAPGLHRRERAAYLMSQHLDIGVVPPTVLRDGPFDRGSFQWFVDADHAEHYFSIRETTAAFDDQFRAIAALDLLINNTDRKAGHCLLAGDRIWAIDNGLCFAEEFKLRTVIWDFAGQPVSDGILQRAERLTDEIPAAIATLLTPAERDALQQRAGMLVTAGHLPVDDTGGHRYPWPLV